MLLSGTYFDKVDFTLKFNPFISLVDMVQQKNNLKDTTKRSQLRRSIVLI